MTLGLPNDDVVDLLHAWRKKVWRRDFPNAVFGPSAILKDSTLEALSSVGPILTLKELERVVGENWAWFGPYGNELLDELISLSIPRMVPKPKEPRKSNTTKRKQHEQEGEDASQKRTRKEAPSQNRPTTMQTPTSVNPMPTPGPSFPAYNLQTPIRVQQQLPPPVFHPGFMTHHPYYPSLSTPHPYFSPYPPNTQNPPQFFSNSPSPFQNTYSESSQQSQPSSFRFIHHDPHSGRPT